MVTQGAPSTPGVFAFEYIPLSKVPLPISGYKKSLPDHSINQNTNIKGINDLYLRITIQHTPQKIS